MQQIHQGLVSIIVPVYNNAEYLQGCVASLLAQTYHDIEVILVDDASSDASPALCDALATDARVIALHQPENKGVSAARNLGMATAKGEYLSFMDGDDTLNPEGIAFLVDLLAQNPSCDVSAFGFYVNDIPQLEQRETPVVWDTQEALQAMFDERRSVVKGSMCNKLFRHRVIAQHHLKVDETAYICEDLLFCMQYLLCSGRMAYHCVPQYRYVHHSGSAMHSGLTARRVSVLDTYQKIIQLAAPLGVPALSEIIQINYLNHHLHLLQVTWKTRDAETMQAAAEIYRSFRPHLGWFLRQKNARAKRKLIALYFYLTAFTLPRMKEKR